MHITTRKINFTNGVGNNIPTLCWSKSLLKMSNDKLGVVVPTLIPALEAEADRSLSLRDTYWDLVSNRRKTYSIKMVMTRNQGNESELKPQGRCYEVQILIWVESPWQAAPSACLGEVISGRHEKWLTALLSFLVKQALYWKISFEAKLRNKL